MPNVWDAAEAKLFVISEQLMNELRTSREQDKYKLFWYP